MHYRRWQRHGDPLHTPPVKEPMACSNEGCPKVAVKKGLCNGHYLRARKGKDMTAPINDKSGPPPAVRGVCSIDICPRPVWNIEQQLCRRHYHQAWKYGDPNRKARLINATWAEILTLVERDPETGCLEWQGYRDKWGYGYTTFEGKRWAVYRLFWVRIYGAIDAETIHHICLNTSCVNIAHLEPKSLSENTREMLSRRWAEPKRICNKHDPSETKWYANGPGKRKQQCKACQRERQQKARDTKKNPPPGAAQQD